MLHSQVSVSAIADLYANLEALTQRVTKLEHAQQTLSSPFALREDQWLTARQLAPLIGYSYGTLKFWRTAGTGGPPYSKKPGKSGSVRYRVSQVNKWLKKQMKTPIELG